MFRHAIHLALLLSICGVAGCQTDQTTPIVADTSPLAPEAMRPMVQGGIVPEQRLLDPNRVVARVNDQIITVRTILAEIGDAVEAARQPEDDSKSAEERANERVRMLLMEYSLRLVMRRLQLETAEKLGVTVTKDDMVRAVASAEAAAQKRGTTLEEDLRARGEPRWEWEGRQRRIILGDKYMAMAMGEMQPVSPETRAIADTRVRPTEIRSYYDRHREDFRQEKAAKVDAIFLRYVDFDSDRNPGTDAETWANNRARSIIARARGGAGGGGEPFDRLVKEVHGEPLSAFQNPFKPGERNGDFVEEFAWGAAIGDVSDPIPLPPGLLILKLVSKTGDRVLPFGEVKDAIARGLGTLKRSAAIMKIQKELLRDAVVEPRALKQRLKDLMARDLEKVLTELSR